MSVLTLTGPTASQKAKKAIPRPLFLCPSMAESVLPRATRFSIRMKHARAHWATESFTPPSSPNLPPPTMNPLGIFYLTCTEGHREKEERGGPRRRGRVLWNNGDEEDKSAVFHTGCSGPKISHKQNALFAKLRIMKHNERARVAPLYLTFTHPFRSNPPAIPLLVYSETSCR